eukprot:CAMPEP_0116121882 /NCGR_PEP_ID=MMETSP0329-20121206/3927_1 /TAXON_ID=697910 /ORGANISM="Pseudo-nitzschia arenysensis, Strain B593" /LENGTH=1003 /DNA_ID=CAMNT_0003615711 /DNA_START=25 /DNA_END=3036 /DNA_ORIENTATION=-
MYAPGAIANLQTDLRESIESRIREFESKIEKFESKIAESQEEIADFKIEIADLSKFLGEDIDNRISTEDDENESNPDRQKTEKDVDADTKYKEAFNESGGDVALQNFKSVSDELRKLVVDATIEAEIDKLLPPSMPWNGASKFLVSQSYVESIDELYKNADKALSVFQKAVKAIAEKATPKAKPQLPGLKSKERAIEKAKFKYADEKGDGVSYYRLTDIVRGTLIYPSIAEMYEGLKLVFESEDFDVEEFNDRFQNPMEHAGAYRDLQLTVKLKECNFLCELQMSTESMIYVKETFGHRDYEVYRRLKSAVQDRDHKQFEATLKFSDDNRGSSYNKKTLPEKCYELVHEAAIMGDAKILDRLIQYGASANTLDGDKKTPLHHAVFHGHQRCVWLLIDKYDCKQDLRDKNDETALMTGYIKFYTKPSEQARRAIATLLQRTDKEIVVKTSTEFQEKIKERLNNKRELVDAAADGDIEKMTGLLREYANPNSEREGKTALDEAVNRENSKVVKLLKDFGVKIPPKLLETAITEENYERTKFLLSHGASIPDDILEKSVNVQNFEITDLLLSSGVSIPGNILEKSVTAKNFDITELLLSRGASIPENILEKAVTAENFHITELLLSRGASVSENILEIAVAIGNDEMTKALVNRATSIPENLLQGAFDNEAYETAKILISTGTNTDNILSSPCTIPCGVEGDWKWQGMALYRTKLFCAPANANDILVINADTKETRTIPCGVEGRFKWSGIACCGNKIFCAPWDASDILVINADTEKTHTIPCGVEGDYKWSGIACCGNKLFCVPCYTNDILVIDADTEETHLLPSGVVGDAKWFGIACYGKKLFCAPFYASDILVIDAITEEIHTIPCGVNGEWKWRGIACYGTKLFCAPFAANSILVIDGESEETRLVPFGDRGDWNWKGIACYGTKLFCAPCNASDILVIDGDSEETYTIPCGVEGSYKWSGIACCGTKLFCAPSYASDVLVIEDRLPNVEILDDDADILPSE